MATLPKQLPNYPNSQEIRVDGIEMLVCMHCGLQAGDCKHTAIDPNECFVCKGNINDCDCGY